MNKKLGCPNCQVHRCKLHKVTPFKVWWYRYINNNFMIAKYWVINLIKGEK